MYIYIYIERERERERERDLKYKLYHFTAAHDTTRSLTYHHKTHHSAWGHRRGYALD
jgi:hypothetical protein